LKSKYRYCLTKAGLERCRKGEFYLQALPICKGYTQRLFYLFFNNHNTALTVGEIYESLRKLKISKDSLHSILYSNEKLGYIKKIPIRSDI